LAPREANMKQNFTETQIKYLAGLIDADGSLLFHFRHYKDGIYNVTLKLVLQQSLSIDKDGKFITSLSEYCGFNQFIEVSKDNKNWSDANRWTVNQKEDLNMLIPRLTKHLVIKARHFQRLLDKYNELYGKSVTEAQMNELKEFAEASRKDTGPLKPKKHASWAWIAGYVDGDGCYYMRSRKKNWGVAKELLVKVVAHGGDIVGLNLLAHSLGGKVNKNSGENTYSWSRNLGNSDRSFALHFLRKMQRHSMLKTHKIEMMLHHHLQRLSESTSTDDAIV